MIRGVTFLVSLLTISGRFHCFKRRLERTRSTRFGDWKSKKWVKQNGDIGKADVPIGCVNSERLCYCSGAWLLGQVTRPPPDAWKRMTASSNEQKLRTPLWFSAVGLPSIAYPTFGPVPVTT